MSEDFEIVRKALVQIPREIEARSVGDWHPIDPPLAKEEKE